jgi:MFS family permease
VIVRTSGPLGGPAAARARRGASRPAPPAGAALMARRQSDRPRLRLYRWLAPTTLGTAVVALAAGFGQFGAVAALGDVAKGFGRVVTGPTIADQAGLSGTELGIGLAVLRLASLGGLPLSGIADRYGRRALLLGCAAGGLCLTALAALSPGYWWFVALFALGRPLLSASAAIAQVIAAEQTETANRARAIALVTAAYGVGSGLTAVIHALASSSLGFRGLFALALVPLVALPVAGRRVAEPDRFVLAATAEAREVPVLGALERAHRRRILLVSAIAFFLAVMSGPANSFIFLYGQNVLHAAGAAIAVMVVGAGATGLLGLVVGQWLADRLGRRPTGALAMVSMALCALLAYSGGRPAYFVGYLLAVLAGALFAPAAGALVNEIFPTSVRASAAGWQVAASVLGAVCGLLLFGTVADVGNRFSTGGLVAFSPAIPAAGLFFLLPETRGREPEEVGDGAPWRGSSGTCADASSRPA